MGCCNGSRPQRVRPQIVQMKQPTVVTQQNVIQPQAARQSTPAVTLKKLVTSKCPICGIPLSVVNVGGRNMSKCVNPNCGFGA